ncbi:MAG: hypothetical protein QOF56_1564 [Acidobacteriaceae bacterium]|jgi:hypothetical protein|nr:hypothetical protein [Acidobacteriaceae bacterium]
MAASSIAAAAPLISAKPQIPPAPERLGDTLDSIERARKRVTILRNAILRKRRIFFDPRQESGPQIVHRIVRRLHLTAHRHRILRPNRGGIMSLMTFSSFLPSPIARPISPAGCARSLVNLNYCRYRRRRLPLTQRATMLVYFEK